MRKTLMTAAAIGLLAGPAMAEPLSLDLAAMDEVTAGTMGMTYPMVPLDFSKNVHLSDMIKNQVDSVPALNKNSLTTDSVLQQIRD